MGNARAQRVGNLIRAELSDLLLKHLRDERIGFATITEVRLTPNLRHAKVYVSVYGEKTNSLKTLTCLQEAAGYLRHKLGEVLRLKYMPELLFVLDETLLRVERLERALKLAGLGEGEGERSESTEIESTEALLTPQYAPTSTLQSDLARKRRDFGEGEARPPRGDRGQRRKPSKKTTARRVTGGRHGSR